MKEPRESIKNDKLSYEYCIKHLQGLLVRRSGGIWDQDPSKPEEEIAKLEEQLKEAQESLEYSKKSLDETQERLRTQGSEAVEMTKAWKIQLERNMKWLQNNIDFYATVKGQHVLKLKESLETMERLKASHANAASLPKTVEEAIKPSLKGVHGIDLSR